MDVNTLVLRGLGGSWHCPLCWEPKQMDNPELHKGWTGLKRGVNWSQNQGSKRDGLKLVILLQEDQDRL